MFKTIEKKKAKREYQWKLSASFFGHRFKKGEANLENIKEEVENGKLS